MSIKLTTKNESANAFIDSLIKDLRKHKVKLNVYLDKSAPYGDEEINGSFTDSPLEMEISVQKPFKKWFPVLVHESCHFDQWREGISLWKKTSRVIDFFEWINGKEFSKEKIEKSINIYRDLELDCERRAVKKIKELSLPINIEDYTKRAAAYVLFYNYIKVSRKWYKIGREPYSIPEIVNVMPQTLDGDFSTLTIEMTSLFEKHI